MWSWIKKHKVIIGTIWGFSTTVFSIYATLYPFEKSPEVVFYEKNAQDVFSLKDTVNGLAIYCNGIDVRKTGLGLKMYNIKLINKGDGSVRKEDYSDAILGLQVENGKVLGAKTGKSSNDELANIIDFSNTDSSKVKLNKLLIGKGDYVYIQFWILYDITKKPSISKPLGRIADAEILYTDEEETEDNIIETLIILILFLAGVGFFVFVLAISIDFISYQSKRIFRRLSFLNYYDENFDHHIPEHRIIFKLYLMLGRKAFIDITNILIDREKLKLQYWEELANKDAVNKFKELFKMEKVSMRVKGSDDIEYESDLIATIDLLSNFGYVMKSEKEIEIDSKFLGELKKALERINPREEIIQVDSVEKTENGT